MAKLIGDAMDIIGVSELSVNDYVSLFLSPIL